MERVRHRFQARSHAMRGGPVLIGGHVWMLSAHPFAATGADAHGHVIDVHFRLWLRRHIGVCHPIGALPLHFSPATRATHVVHRHIHRFGCRRGGGRFATPERTFSPFPPWPLWIGFGFLLGERAGRPRFAAQLLFQLIHCFPQPPIFLPQPVILGPDSRHILAQGFVLLLQVLRTLVFRPRSSHPPYGNRLARICPANSRRPVPSGF